jgi:hypothetical protein
VLISIIKILNIIFVLWFNYDDTTWKQHITIPDPPWPPLVGGTNGKFSWAPPPVPPPPVAANPVSDVVVVEYVYDMPFTPI